MPNNYFNNASIARLYFEDEKRVYDAKHSRRHPVELYNGERMGPFEATDLLEIENLRWKLNDTYQEQQTLAEQYEEARETEDF
jgi:hypothetical protein